MTIADSRYSHSSPLYSASTWTADQTFNDDVKVTLGTGGDVDFFFDGNDTYLENVGHTGGVMIGLAASPPAPDGDGVHIWSATAGSVTANANGDELILENSTHGGMSILTPNSAYGLIYFGDPDANNAASLAYNHGGPRFEIAFEGSDRLLYGAGAFAFQEATTISTSATTLTLDPATDVIVANGHGLIVGHTARTTDLSEYRLGPSTGTPTRHEAAGVNPTLQVLGTSRNDSHMVLGRYSADEFGAGIYFLKGRHATDYQDTTKAEINDNIGSIIWSAEDGGGGPVPAAELTVQIDTATGDNDMGGRMMFATSPDGSRVPLERLRIDSAGNITFGTNTPTLAVTGTRIAQSYHTNITSTNALTVDSSRTVKKNIRAYDGDALAAVLDMEVVTYEHTGHLASDDRRLGIIAESVNEPLATNMIDDGVGGSYPGVNSYGLDTLMVGAIQRLTARIEALEGG